MITVESKTEVSQVCYHCGDNCLDNSVCMDDKVFCCNGCVQVYKILHAHELTDYYCMNDNPGIKKEEVEVGKFKFLDSVDIVRQLIKFQNKYQAQVELHLPQIHCSSCLWLLEHLSIIDERIIASQVNFTTKNVFITYDVNAMSLREVAEILTSIGYEPLIDTNGDNDNRIKKKYNAKTAYLKIGISGFAFSNIMLISFPDYLGLDIQNDSTLADFFKWVNLFLSLPVIFYCAQEFFINAYYSFRQKYLNIDTPIALAIAVTFIRSMYEVVSNTGTGFFDSMTGIVFFMLLGRTLQNRTYSTLSFTRDYKSYFPIAVTKIDSETHEEHTIQIQDIQEHDILWIHHGEVIPTDCFLSKGQGVIDYSFITGETLPENVEKGELIYAGGKNVGEAIEILTVKPFSQNSFTQLWNNKAFEKVRDDKEAMTTIISKYFSLIVILIALGTFLYWQVVNPDNAWKAATAVLIVACPCSLLLTSSFTNGYLLDALSKKGFFLKNAQVVEAMSQITHVAFDKTGTITSTANGYIVREFDELSPNEWNIVWNIMNQSTHPLSRSLVNFYKDNKRNNIRNIYMREIPGKGIEAWYDDRIYKIGSRKFVLNSEKMTKDTEVLVSIDGELKATFAFRIQIKEGVEEMLSGLKTSLSLISGDNDSSKSDMQRIFSSDSQLLFGCSPEDKLRHIQSLQKNRQKVMMVGDGLNDAGALQQSDVGVTVVKKSFSFSPACDVIMEHNNLPKLHQLIAVSKATQKMILIGFIYSIVFNIVGISYAVTAELSPMIAAILMPLSSWGIILIAYIGVRYYNRKYL